MTIEEIYDETIKPLAPSERFRLARRTRDAYKMSSSGYHVGRVERSEARRSAALATRRASLLDLPYEPCCEVHCVSVCLSEIPPQCVVDIRDAWNEEDMRDISAYSARLFTAEFPGEDDLVEIR